MIEKKTWQEFRQSGLFCGINMILHTFGWAIVVNFEDYDKKTDSGTIVEVYPARVKFRGFGENNNTEGYQKISRFMKENAEHLEKEALD